MAGKDLFGNDLPQPEEFEYLKHEDEETQLEAMRDWFYASFQDPADETPYDSEDGYVYLYGGPYDPEEVLREKFEGKVPEEVLDDIIKEIGDESWEWERRPRPEDYDDYVLDTIAPASEQVGRYNANIGNIRKLIAVKIEAAEEQFLLRMLFASVVTLLETYLSDIFVSSIKGNPNALRKFVETFPRFKDEGFKLSEIFGKWEGLEHRVRTILVGEIVWHRLLNIGKMFKSTFDVDFPEAKKLAELLRAIDIRHDLVHRSGMNQDGAEHLITRETIENLIKETDALVEVLETQNEKLDVTDPTTEPEEPTSADEISF
jgi:hypothetical protein